ncbi:YsnF/AvaK domain-containing protein [Sphingomonas profundi]|uniref:YsnF/AvaK domain-containing protein n=1 Tax=Alterirhizorhabdus profundi TaxID=2681549 RepID=UPI0018D1E2EC|nr:DUF2382 domain-containing protein [Sphingomonas profundi]
MIQEEAHVTKREVEIEQVQVRTSFEQETVTVRDTVSRHHVEIRRLPVEREVAIAPPIREEDGITIVPVLEERLVVEKRLFLVEEIHLVRRQSTEEVALLVELRRPVVDVDRSSDNNQEENV